MTIERSQEAIGRKIVEEQELTNVINSIRKAITASNLEREKEGSPRLFMATEAEVEIKFTTRQEKNGKLTLSVAGIGANAGAKNASEQMHTLKLVFAPIVQSTVDDKNQTQWTVFTNGQAVPLKPSPHIVTIHTDHDSGSAASGLPEMRAIGSDAGKAGVDVSGVASAGGGSRGISWGVPGEASRDG